MKFPYGKRRPVMHDQSSAPERPQGPIAVGGTGQLMIDQAFWWRGKIVVSGWRIGPVELSLESDRGSLPARLFPIARPDVSRHFDRTEEKPGFVAMAACADGQPGEGMRLTWACAGQSGSVDLATSFTTVEAAAEVLPGAARAVLLRETEFGDADWTLLAAIHSPVDSDSARGYLENAVAPAGTPHAVVCGWSVGAPGTMFWLRDDRGGCHSLTKSSWRMRRDVADSVGVTFGPRALRSGFVAHLDSVEGVRSFSLLALTDQGVHVIGHVEVELINADPVSVSRWLFGIPVADAELGEHHDRVELPLLNALIERGQRNWEDAPITVRQLGTALESPDLSIVVPLYGRYDFVESQMLEWVRDPDLLRRAELIYVVDDAALMPQFASSMEELHRLYRVPVRWVFGGINRGFSGANNLGAAHARAPVLLFLNSDVFPQRSGWIEPMLGVLREHPNIGAVGPRLVFAEGGIQHAGMRFEWLDEVQVWINRHPWLGLDPELDPSRGLTRMPAVTGACLMLRRCDFDAVGGWDTGYLIGDFEDSDLCLKLQRMGLVSAYLPDVQMVHLERQSMCVIGERGFRYRVTLWNALRHQRRWGALIESVMADGSARYDLRSACDE